MPIPLFLLVLFLTVLLRLPAVEGGFAGGHHLVHAGKDLQAAAVAWQQGYDVDNNNGNNKPARRLTTGPQLLQNAGQALIDIADGWTHDNWEVVAYEAADCADYFVALSLLQQGRPDLQRIYRTMAGELHQLSSFCPNNGGVELAPHWEH